jgi:hypothetical protein
VAPAAGVLTVPGMNGTAGAPPPPGGLAGAPSFAQLRRLVVLGIGELQRQVADARTVAAQAAEVIRQREDELRRLRRVLAYLEEEAPEVPAGARAPSHGPATGPLGRGSRVGGGIGGRASVFILNAALERYRVSGMTTFTTGTMRVALKPFPGRTVQDGLTRLLQDGLVQRTRPGCYELTPAGLAQPPAATRDLLLPRPETAEATP